MIPVSVLVDIEHCNTRRTHIASVVNGHCKRLFELDTDEGIRKNAVSNPKNTTDDLRGNCMFDSYKWWNHTCNPLTERNTLSETNVSERIEPDSLSTVEALCVNTNYRTTQGHRIFPSTTCSSYGYDRDYCDRSLLVSCYISATKGVEQPTVSLHQGSSFVSINSVTTIASCRGNCKVFNIYFNIVLPEVQPVRDYFEATVLAMVPANQYVSPLPAKRCVSPLCNNEQSIIKLTSGSNESASEHANTTNSNRHTAPFMLRVQILQIREKLIMLPQPELLTLAALKRLLHSAYGIPVEQQLLYHNRKKIECYTPDTTTLAQCGFQNEDLLTVNLRLLGGGRLTKRKVVDSPIEEWVSSPSPEAQRKVPPTPPTLGNMMQLAPLTPEAGDKRPNTASPSVHGGLYYGQLLPLDCVDDVDRDGEMPIPNQMKHKQPRPYKQLYANPPHISNTILRMSTLNMNGILKQNNSNVGPLAAHIKEFDLHILILIDHRLTTQQMEAQVHQLRRHLGKDITHVTASVTLYGKPTATVPARHIAGYQQTVGGVAILAIGGMSSCLQPSTVRDPTGAGTFCGAWLHIPDMPKIHIMAVYLFPKSLGHGFTVYDRITQYLATASYTEKDPLDWFHLEIIRQHRRTLDITVESIAAGDFNTNDCAIGSKHKAYDSFLSTSSSTQICAGTRNTAFRSKTNTKSLPFPRTALPLG